MCLYIFKHNQPSNISANVFVCPVKYMGSVVVVADGWITSPFLTCFHRSISLFSMIFLYYPSAEGDKV